MPPTKALVPPPGDRPPPKAILAWSSGKDGAMALYRVQKSRLFDVVALVTTVTEGFQRVSIHGVREELIELQAQVLGLPLHKVLLPFPCPNAIYEERFGNALDFFRDKGVTHIIFGDVHLEDVRKYREEKLVKQRLTAVFPLWHEDTRALANETLQLGFQAVLTCVDSKKVPAQFSGHKFDRTLLNQLPVGVDPCGENGEFHTFVLNGPNFSAPIAVEVGESISRQGFHFTDLLTTKQRVSES